MEDRILRSQFGDIVKALYEVSDDAKKSTRAALRKAAEPVVRAARNAAPISEETHYRYSTAKATKSIRAPKGQGKKVATYNPGNLRGSIKALVFRRAKYSIFVGPVVARGIATGTFGPDSSFSYEGGQIGASKRSDGYYGAWVEFGAPLAGIPPSPYMKPAEQQQGATALRIAVKELKKAIEDSGEKQYRKWLQKYAQIRGRT